MGGIHHGFRVAIRPSVVADAAIAGPRRAGRSVRIDRIRERSVLATPEERGSTRHEDAIDEVAPGDRGVHAEVDLAGVPARHVAQLTALTPTTARGDAAGLSWSLRR